MTGYRSDNVEGTLKADFSGLPKFQLDFNKIPTETVLQTIVNGDQKMLKTDYMELRDAQVIYYFSHLMIREYYTSKEHGQKFQKFSDIRNIVQEWYDRQLEIIGGNGSVEQKRLVMLWNYKAVLASIMEGVHQANADHEEINAVLNYYNPEGSTRHVFRPTNKEVISTQHCHVNYVIAEQESWVHRVCQVLEKSEAVVAWGKNTYLGFRIPYIVSDETKDYQPDFLVKMRKPDGSVVNLIVEFQDFDNDKSGNKDAKRHYLKDYWIPAANHLQSYGKWELVEVRDIEQFEKLLNEK